MPFQLVTGPTAEPLSLTQAKTHVREPATAQDALLTDLIVAARRACETRTQNQVLAATWKLVLDSFPGPGVMGVSYVPWGRTYGLPGNAIVLAKAPVLSIDAITYLDMQGVTQTLTAGQSNDYVAELSGAPARITPPFGKVWPPNVMPQVGAVTVQFKAGHAAKLTADATADTVSVPGWKTLAVNDAVRFSNRDGALPAPLAAYTDYYVKTVAGTDLYTLSATPGGAQLDLTSTGTGDSFIGEIPANLRAWMLLAIGTMYENRESVSVDTRITQVELPEGFREGLLDPHRLVLY